ncbi:MAG: GILT family protein [Nanoarchaeota archaeon]|nr:GILT family protein [Nanoarchaeota archaeon]
MEEHKHEAEHHSHESHVHHEAEHHEAPHEHKAPENKPEHSEHKKEHGTKAPKRKPEHKVVRRTEKQHKAGKPKAVKRNYVPYVIGGIILVVIIALIVRLASKPAPVEVDNPGQYGSVDVEFYVMSQCPYGIQVENAIQPVLDELGDNMDFRLEFIASKTATGFDSLHGPPEVIGDKVQLCVQDMYPDDLIDFVVCQNKDPRDLMASLEKCAKGTSIDPVKVKECAEGEKGNELLSGSAIKSQEVGAQGSPTMFFNGQPYAGGRDSASFKRAVCAGLSAHPLCEGLSACSADTDCREELGKIGTCENPGKKDAKCTYRDDAAVTLTIVNAKECTSCDPSQLVAILSQVFLNIEVKSVDASSAEGKALVKKYSLENAPSLIFSEGLEKTYAWGSNERIRGAFRKAGTELVMLDEASGSSYILDAKKRAEFEKLTGVTKGDNKPQIDFYVMSYCPYGNIAEEAIEPVYQLLRDKAEFNPHYVIYSNYGGGGPQYCMDAGSKYCSMHGVQEMNQGIRELCVDKYMGIDAYFKFVLEMNRKCNYQNADSCWEGVAKSLKLDTAKIKECEASEGETIAAAELELNKALGVQGSPTVFVEGAAYNGARAPAGYAQALCAGFETAPGECSAASLGSLAGASASPAASEGGCG